MPFSDDDLKRVKAMIAEPSEEEDPKIILFNDTASALIARLEAAEAYAWASPAPYGVDLIRLRRAWFLAAGKS